MSDGGNNMKNDYTRNYFWVKTDKNGNKRYYFKIRNQLVEVDKEVFNICFSSYRKQQRDIQQDKDAGLISLNALNDYNQEYTNTVGVDHDYIHEIYVNDEVARILELISQLNPNDRELITNLLIREKTEKEIAECLKVSQQSINKRKKQIIQKIRKKLK